MENIIGLAGGLTFPLKCVLSFAIRHQGVVVPSSSFSTTTGGNAAEFVVDDSTGIITVEMTKDSKGQLPQASQYVMIIGVVVDDDYDATKRRILAHQVIDLSSSPGKGRGEEVVVVAVVVVAGSSSQL